MTPIQQENILFYMEERARWEKLHIHEHEQERQLQKERYDEYIARINRVETNSARQADAMEGIQIVLQELLHTYQNRTQ